MALFQNMSAPIGMNAALLNMAIPSGRVRRLRLSVCFSPQFHQGHNSQTYFIFQPFQLYEQLRHGFQVKKEKELDFFS